jgi:hypothetical protein
MEFKDITTWSVSKGVATPKNQYFCTEGYYVACINLPEGGNCEGCNNYLKFEQFAQQHTYATDAPDGSYSADRFGEIVWQYEIPNEAGFWFSSKDQSYYEHDFKFYAEYINGIGAKNTRQFLPFIDQVKAESPKFGEWKEALLKAKSTLWSLSVGAYSYEEIRTLSRAEYNRIRLALGEIDSLPSPPKTL